MSLLLYLYSCAREQKCLEQLAPDRFPACEECDRRLTSLQIEDDEGVLEGAKAWCAEHNPNGGKKRSKSKSRPNPAPRSSTMRTAAGTPRNMPPPRTTRAPSSSNMGPLIAFGVGIAALLGAGAVLFLGGDEPPTTNSGRRAAQSQVTDSPKKQTTTNVSLELSKFVRNSTGKKNL